MTFLNRHRSRIRPVGPFAPSSLFFGGIPGAWYDPTDLSTMFQDSTGTTPVTAVEQPVGLILDKSQGLALGSELVTNGDFSGGATGWTAAGTTALAVNAGVMRATDTADGAAFGQQINFVANTWYRLQFSSLSDGTSKAAAVYLGTTLGSSNRYAGSAAFGTNRTVYYRATATETLWVWFYPGFFSTTNYILIDDVTVRPVAGNHASQSTAASRPTYRARYNALTQSETFTGAPWLTGSTSGAITRSTISTQDPTGATSNVSTVAFPAVPAGQFSIVYQDSGATYLNVNITWSVWLRVASGTATIYLNVEDTAAGPGAGNFFASPPLTLTTTWQRFTLTGTRTANTGNLGVFFGFDTRASAGQTNAAPLTVQVWGAQLLTAADVTATGNAYQRIAAATVYDTAAVFRPYLAFDGVDDSLATAAINFTSTDKMSVFSGVTKNAEAVGCIAELSTSGFANNGTFSYFGIGSQYPTGFDTPYRGTAANGNPGFNAPAPTPRVNVQLYDIGAPRAVIRSNGAQVYADSISVGTGAFGTWPLFIGRRGGTMLPFNGRLYSLIVRGAASSTTEIIDTETWVNARTGGY